MHPFDRTFHLGFAARVSLVLCLAVGAVQGFALQAWAGDLNAFAEFQIEEGDGNGGQEVSAQTGPIVAAAFDSESRAVATASADFGLIGASAEVAPGVDDPLYRYAHADASFSDGITVSGDNSGAQGEITLVMRVEGFLLQPFVVTEVTANAQADFVMSASSDNDDADAERDYQFEFIDTEQEQLLLVDELVSLVLQFEVGEPINFSAWINALAEVQSINGEAGDKFQAAFGNTAELQAILLTGVVNPTISSDSGTDYSVYLIPEPRAFLLACIAVVCGWPLLVGPRGITPV